MNKKIDLINVKMGVVDIPNHNNRIYPRKVIESELNRVFGEGGSLVLGTAYRDGEGYSDLVLKLEDATHIIKDGWIDGREIRGEIKLLDNIESNSRRQMLEILDEIELLPRGVGSLEKNRDGVEVVQDDYVLHGFDIILGR